MSIFSYLDKFKFNLSLKRSFIFIAVVFVVLVIILQKLNVAEPRCIKCNVILISIDNLNAKQFKPHGHDSSASPFLDKIIQEKGIVFENAIAQSSWALPSYAAMFTGKYPAELGVWGPEDALPLDTKTFTQTLREDGFKTQAFSAGPFVQPEWGFDRGFDGFYAYSKLDNNNAIDIFRDASQWLRVSGEMPFFLFVRSFYDGKVYEFDEAIENFFIELDKTGLLENTIIVLVGAYGEGLEERDDTGESLSLHNEVVHVPLIFFLPHTKAQRIKEVVETRAISSTILSILGLAEDSTLDTGSLLFPYGPSGGDRQGVALSTTAFMNDVVFGDDKEFGREISPKPREGEWFNPFASSARSARWHILSNINGTFELYDLNNDPGEKNNLFYMWSDFQTEDRREALRVFRALGADVPMPCGAYCTDDTIF